MKRSVYCSFAVLLVLCTLLLAQNTTLLHPMIVAKVTRIDAKSPVPTTTIFTPKQTGLYQINTYFNVVSSTFQNANWGVDITWTDSDNTIGTGTGVGGVNLDGPPGSLHWSSSVLTVLAKGGTPIQYGITPSNPPPMGTTYTLFMTIQQL